MIKLLINGSKVFLFTSSSFDNSILNSLIIFFALSSISFKSSLSKLISSKIIYFELLKISSKVFALFLRKFKDFLIISFLSDLISSLNNAQ